MTNQEKALAVVGLVEEGVGVEEALTAVGVMKRAVSYHARLTPKEKRQDPSSLYHRWAQVAGKMCDVCGSWWLPKEMKSRDEVYMGQQYKLMFCPSSCEEEWDAQDPDRENVEEEKNYEDFLTRPLPKEEMK